MCSIYYIHYICTCSEYEMFRFYAATKFMVRALLEGWRQEVREGGTNIRVSGLSPGI